MWKKKEKCIYMALCKKPAKSHTVMLTGLPTPQVNIFDFRLFFVTCFFLGESVTAVHSLYR